MAIITLRSFGGMAPSAPAKALPESGATYCCNLDLRFTDFRPLPTPAEVAVVDAGATLYKFETTGGFTTRTGEVRFVRGPIPTDSTERTYYTGDGAPKVTDASGAVRQLGVPAPTNAPAVAINASAQYSRDDAAAAQGSKLLEFTNLLLANSAEPYVGATDADLAAKFVPNPDNAPWSYMFKIPGTMSGSNLVPTNANHRALMDPSLGYHIGTDGGVQCGFATITVRGAAFNFTAGLSAALQGIADPSDSTGAKKLIPAAKADAIVASLNDALKPANAVRDAAALKIEALLKEFTTLADSGSPSASSLVEAMIAFYARAEVSSTIDNAVAHCVTAIRSGFNTFDRT